MKEEIQDIPKIVLHIHLDGSLDVKLAHKWLLEDGYTYTLQQVESKLQVGQDCENLNEYLEKFDIPCKILNTAERLKTATYQLFTKLAKQNVIYAEVRFAPLKHINKNLNIDEVVQAVIEGMNESKKENTIYGGIILCCMRGNTKEQNMQTVETAKKYLNKGVCGIDLAGAESLYPTKDYEYSFNYAKELNVPYTIHSGEADGISSINSAINFGTKRIGHGVRCIDNIATIQEIIDRDILLEICLTSNYQTEAIKGKHPLEELYRKGVKISINTDNDTVSNIDINSEYERVLKETNLTINDIIKCNYNSIPYIFATDEIKEKLKEVYKELI